MKAIALTTLLIASVACALILLSSLPFSPAQVSTEVSGLITSNATWTKTGGPYILSGPVALSNGATLTIQPGCSVLLGQFNLLINGTLNAQGSSADPIRFQGGANGVDSKGNLIYPITFTPFSTSWNQQTNTGCIIDNAILQSTSIYISQSPKISNSNFDNSFIWITNSTLNAEPTPVPASPTITNNTFKGSSTSLGIATYSSIGLIANNTISSYTTGIEMHSDQGTQVQGNLITNNTYGIQLIAQIGPVFANIKNNTITNNTIGISLQKTIATAMSPTIQFNNIYANSNYSISSAVSDPINATNNWWGTTNSQSINQTIYDAKQNSNIGVVNFVPFLTAPINAPTPTPTPTPTPAQPPLATSAFTNVSVMTGQSWYFFAHSSGGVQPHTYQWYEGTTQLPGQNSMLLLISKTTAGTYTYTCKVTDAQGTIATSNTVTLTVTNR